MKEINRRLMKKMVLLLLAALVVNSGCSLIESYNPEFTLGIIETTGQKNKSTVSFYGTDLIEVGALSFPYGSMDYYGFTEPRGKDGHLFTVPLGLYNRKDLGMILDLDLQSGKAEKVNFGRVNITSAEITEDAYYVASNLNQISYLDRYDRKTGTITTISLEEELVMHIKEHQGRLLGIGQTAKGSEMKVSLNEFNFETKEVDILKDMTSLGDEKSAPIHMASHAGILYLSLGQKLLIYSDKDTDVEEIELSKPYAQQILIYEEKVYILHADIVAGSINSIITIFDPKTKETDTFDLEMKIWQMEIKDDLLYALDLENRRVTQYKMDDGSFLRMGSTEIETADGMTVSAMFLK